MALYYENLDESTRRNKPASSTTTSNIVWVWGSDGGNETYLTNTIKDMGISRRVDVARQSFCHNEKYNLLILRKMGLCVCLNQ